MPTSGNVLVDTCLVIDYFRQPSDLHTRFEEAGDLFLSLTVLGELLFGAFKSKRADVLLAQVREFQSGCIVISPDEGTAEEYGRIKSELSDAGKPIPENDVWIAAIARQHGIPLATRDRHFSFVSGLDLLDW